MNLDDQIESALRRRPADEPTYDQALSVAEAPATPGELERLRPTTRIRRRRRVGAVPALAALCAVAILGAGSLIFGLPGIMNRAGESPTSSVATARASNSSAPTASVLDTGGPIPEGMLPLGPTTSLNQPPAACAPGVPPGVDAPHVYEAVPLDSNQAQMAPAAGAEVVDYNWGGHRPLAADRLRVTVPDLRGALNLNVALMRLVVATSDGTCFGEWRVAARSVGGYDGSQDAGDWIPLGDGTAAADAVVVAGLPDGDWIVHIHLEYVAGGSASTYSLESYVRVVVGGRVDLAAAIVPAPDPVADCTGKSLQQGRVPDVALTVDAAAGKPGVLGTITTGASAGVPSAIPAGVVSIGSGELFTVRPTDGSCGNDWSGLYFLPVPDTLAGPIANLSGLPSNNGGPQNATTPPLIGAIRGMAPAPGEWLVGVILFFGGSDPPCYYWRISVH